MSKQSKDKVVIPKLSTIEKYIQRIRRIEKLDGRFREWTIASLIEYPIEPDAIPLVFDIYDDRQAANEILRIIEVQWIGRLHRLTTQMPPEKFKEIIGDCVSGELMMLYDREYRPSKHKRDNPTVELGYNAIKDTISRAGIKGRRNDK